MVRRITSFLLLAVVLASVAGAPPTAAIGEGGDPWPYVQMEYRDIDVHWRSVFEGAGFGYASPSLAVISEPTATPCGDASPVVGQTFYCARNTTIYYAGGDLAGDWYVGDFAITFTIAHEWAHHLQRLVYDASAFTGDDSSVLFFELQADCLAGSYGNALTASGVVEPGDIEEALAIALVIGDPVLADGQTHGSPEERVDAYMDGFNTGSCRTFGW